MTWYFSATDNTVDLYDPAGDLVAEAVPFSGSWSEYPQEALRDEVATHLTELAGQDLETAVLWAFEWLSGDIEAGTP